MKTILSILFLFVCAFAHAQYHNVEGIRVVGRSDSTTISNVGQIQFDADDDKFRFNDGTGWFSFLKEGASLPYWPLSGNFSTTGAQSITLGGTLQFSQGNHDVFFGTSNNNRGFRSVTTIFRALSRGFNVFLEGDDNGVGVGGYSASGGGTPIDSVEFHAAQKIVFKDSWATQPNIVLEADMPELDTANWVLVRENSTGQIKKRSVSSIVSSGAFWPLTGTAALTGNVTINGGGTRDLSFGSSGSRLDDLWVYADNQALIDVASGNNVNRVTLQPGFSSFALLDTDGETLDVEILVQPGAADILRIVKDESVTVFEINADGSIVYGAPPTNCTGRATNTIWSDGGTLKLCP